MWDRVHPSSFELQVETSAWLNWLADRFAPPQSSILLSSVWYWAGGLRFPRDLKVHCTLFDITRGAKPGASSQGRKGEGAVVKWEERERHGDSVYTQGMVPSLIIHQRRLFCSHPWVACSYWHSLP